MPARPAPLKTSLPPPPLHTGRHAHTPTPFSPLPSELPRTPIHNTSFDSLRSSDDALKTPITPPSAYTDFLKNTVNSPALASLTSPRNSISYSPVVASTRGGYLTPVTGKRGSVSAVPVAVPVGGRMPPSPDVSSEEDEGDDRDRRGGVRDGAQNARVTVKQIVKTTVTYAPHMSLMPAPKGKRRRVE